MGTEYQVVAFQIADLRAFPALQAAWEAAGQPAITGPAYTATKDGKVIGVAGVLVRGGGTGEAWLQLAPGANGDGRWIAWTVRKMLDRLAHEHGFTRIQALIDPRNPLAERFARVLGFTCEGRMRAFWNGEDRDLYAKIYVTGLGPGEGPGT